MMLTLTVPPDGHVVLVRGEAVIGLESPFAWSPAIQARTVKLTNGQSLIVLDTPANLTALTTAITGSGGSVQPSPIVATETGGSTSGQ